MRCRNCDKEFPTYMNIDGRVQNLSTRKFCIECSPFNAHNTKAILEKKAVCKNCGVKLSNRQKLFCDTNCKAEYYYNDYIKRWKNGLEDGTRGKYDISTRIRKYLFDKYNNRCCKCGWSIKNSFTDKVPLEVHHIDGNYTNNKEDNLELLCPNCHSLTATYKASNKNGRENRMKLT